MWVSTTARRRSPGVVSGLPRGHVSAGPGALGARQGRLDHQQVGVAGDLDQLIARRQSAPYVNLPPPFVELKSIA